MRTQQHLDFTAAEKFSLLRHLELPAVVSTKRGGVKNIAMKAVLRVIHDHGYP